MNQRLAVRAVIRKNAKTLLVRRANGRQTILGKYELPGGKIHYGEQPEDTLARYLKDDTGLTIQTAQLFDVLTYIDHDDRDMQYVFILYLVSLTPDGSRVELSQNYNKYIWEKIARIQQNELTESAKLLLGIAQQDVQSVKKNEIVSNDVGKATDTSHVVIYSDGGSRGNPGHSAGGFVILDSNHNVIQQGGVYLGITTNNVAEYHGVRIGLEKALEMGVKTIDFRIDSLLVVNQLNGIYHIKNRELWPVNERVQSLVAQFNKVTFTHVKREFNQLADGMVNKILNAEEAK